MGVGGQSGESTTPIPPLYRQKATARELAGVTKKGRGEHRNAESVSAKPSLNASEDALGDLQALLLHARQRGAGHVFGPSGPGEATLLQHKVVVGR